MNSTIQLIQYKCIQYIGRRGEELDGRGRREEGRKRETVEAGGRRRETVEARERRGGARL